MSNPYRPRRANKRWLEGAPEYVLDVFRDGPKSNPNGYFILFWDKAQDRTSYADTWVGGLEINRQPTHPAYGVSLTTQLRAHDAANYRYRRKHMRVRWSDVPEELRKHIRARYEDCRETQA
jgi:hypothetical protein